MQFVKYCNVGLVGAVINYGIFWLLYHVGVNYMVASAFGYMACMAFAYVVNRRWTFGSRHHVLAGYVMVCLFSLIIGTGVLHLLVDEVGIWPQVATLMVMTVTTVLNFTGFKYLLARKE